METTPTKKKYAVYTAIFGDYDSLIAPKYDSLLDEVDYYCFTDDKSITSSRIKVIYVKRMFSDLTRCARYLKVMGHPLLQGYQFTIWIDACYMLNIKSIAEFNLEAYTDVPFITFKESTYNCLYDHALICIYCYKDFYYKILQQLIAYKLKGMPINYGSYETGILIKQHSHPDCADFQKIWWQEISKRSKRDQLSLPFCAWKKNYKIGLLEGTCVDNKYATHSEHKMESAKQESPILNKIEFIERNTPYLRLYASRFAKIIKLL